MKDLDVVVYLDDLLITGRTEHDNFAEAAEGVTETSGKWFESQEIKMRIWGKSRLNIWAMC